MKLFSEQGLLREPAGGGDGSGGAVTEESVKTLINTALNGAITKLNGELTTKMGTMLKPFEGLGEQLTALTTNLTEVQTKLSAAPTPGDGKSGKATDPEVAAMLKKLETSQANLTTQLAQEKEKRETAEKAAQKSTKDAGLQSALSKFQFANEQAAEDAFSLLAGQVEFGEDGKLVAGGLPLSDFVADFIPNKKSYLLAPQNKGGAGANAGNGRGGASNVQFESIKAGMSAEDTRAAATAILNVTGRQ